MPIALPNLYWVWTFSSSGWRLSYVKGKWTNWKRENYSKENPKSSQCLVLWPHLLWFSPCLLLQSHSPLCCSLSKQSFSFFLKHFVPKYRNAYLLSLSLCPNVTCSMIPDLTCYLKSQFVSLLQHSLLPPALLCFFFIQQLLPPPNVYYTLDIYYVVDTVSLPPLECKLHTDKQLCLSVH